MRFRRAVAVTAICIASSQATAAEWQLFAASDDEVVEIDVGSVHKRGPYTTAWFQYSRSEAHEDGELSSKRLYQVACSSRKMGLLNYVGYNKRYGKGQVTGSDQLSEEEVEMYHVVPGSLGEAVFEAACHLQAKGTMRGYSPEVDEMIGALLKPVADTTESSEAQCVAARAAILEATSSGERAAAEVDADSICGS